MKIPTYIINLKNRTDRLEHSLNEFNNKSVFNINIIEACPEKRGNIGLWNTIRIITKQQFSFPNHPFILICEDDHQFTHNYNEELFLESIKEAINLNADILSGGVSSFETGIQISKNFFWVKDFTGFQFTIIFRNFYSKILNADFNQNDAADHKLSSLSEKKFVIYPFISIQKEFGYSDVTNSNNEPGRVKKMFDESSEHFALLQKVRTYFLPDFK